MINSMCVIFKCHLTYWRSIKDYSLKTIESEPRGSVFISWLTDSDLRYVKCTTGVYIVIKLVAEEYSVKKWIAYKGMIYLNILLIILSIDFHVYVCIHL